MKVVENCKKTFTNDERNIIIKENYNPLIVNCKSIYKRGGLFMKKEETILDSIMEVLDWKGKLIVKLFLKTFIKVYYTGKSDYFKYIKK